MWALHSRKEAPKVDEDEKSCITHSCSFEHCFFLCFAPLSLPLYSFTDLLQTQLSIGDRGLGVGPTGEDLGFISCLCSALAICIKFVWGHML